MPVADGEIVVRYERDETGVTATASRGVEPLGASGGVTLQEARSNIRALLATDYPEVHDVILDERWPTPQADHPEPE